MKLLFLFLTILCTNFLNAQQYSIRGKVWDSKTSAPLSFANIRVAGTTRGTATNSEGEYELKLTPGNYTLIASYIGYYSDTLSVVLTGNIENMNFNLDRTEILLPEVIVEPGINPAIGIIKKAIKRKNERNKKLFAYEFKAYTKGIVKTEGEIYRQGGGVTMDSGSNDTSLTKITAIFENESEVFFKKPNHHKEIIKAQKQSANFPSSLNTLTGGRIIQNFYDENVKLFGTDIPGPLKNDALDYYDFYLDNPLGINNKKVFKIKMYPKNDEYPGFIGSIFITDSTFDLIKVDLQINRAANTGGVFEKLNIVQQFADYNGFYMPIDYHLLVKFNYLNLLRFGFEMNSILYAYQINPQISDDVFSKAVITVLPEADKKDSTYWKSIQSIPGTREEKLAYKRIDSLSHVKRTFWDKFSFLSFRIFMTDKFAVSGPLSLYNFNRVEGHTLNFGFYLDDALNRRLNSHLKFSYGFSDKRFKTDFYAKYFLGNYRTYNITVNAYNKLKTLFGTSDSYNDLTASLTALLFKTDFRDYYYSNGFDVKLTGAVTPVIDLNVGFINRTDHSARQNSDFSFFNTNRAYRQNPAINEGKVNAITAGFTLDFRDYVEDGYFRRRTSFGGSYIVFWGDVTYSNNSLLNSSYDFTTYKLWSRGFVRTFRSAYFVFDIFGMYNDGKLPFQNLYSLPGNINYISKSSTFRTLDINEVLGEKVITVNLSHQFQDELFKFLGIPGLKNWEITLKVFLNMAISDVGNKTERIIPVEVKKLPHPFYELGFGIGQGLLPFEIDFAWKLNYRGSNNFRVSLNAFVF